MVDEREEKLRQAFLKIKQDMQELKQEISHIKQDLGDLIHMITRSTHPPAHPQHFDTQNAKINEIKPYFSISKGNDGVPADSQQMFDTSKTEKIQEKTPKIQQKQQIEQLLQQPQQLSLRQIKKLVESFTQDLKLKFKALSRQEFYIFSLIYNLDIKGQKPDYKTIAIRANLTESSVRDYVSRLIHKGIPIKKEKINNKQIIITIPDELKSLATLDNLTKLKQSQEEEF